MTEMHMCCSCVANVLLISECDMTERAEVQCATEC
jgi:hypothetical protein